MQQNFTTGDPLALDRIRATLIRLEDTIIFMLIERAQFAHNAAMYKPGGVPELRETGFEGSWLAWFLRETETFHAKARRYTSPDEYPFTAATELPPPLLVARETHPALLYANDINVNATIQELYVRDIVPRITQSSSAGDANANASPNASPSPHADDDGHYGSAATLDVEVLQALSKRVHYGKFVSESKFRADPHAFVGPIRERDREALAGLITKPEVERTLLVRVHEKARVYGQDVGVGGGRGGEGKIEVESVVELYERHVIPLTKEVEVDYLLQRLDGLTPEEVDGLSAPKSS
ncbi:hypothetical protein M0805_002337 [Coniferiporia weirii]|nr:hypothetical protein M0805_002337 [Coniferiporia weirii]